jgi:hypothetical protein
MYHSLDSEFSVGNAVGRCVLGLVLIVMLIASVIVSHKDGEEQGKSMTKQSTIQRAMDEDLVWYDKKGKLVYSGNMQYVLTGEKE